MADQTPSSTERPPDTGLTGQIEKGATAHDAVGTSLGNVTDVDLARQRLVIDGRPVGHEIFEVPLSTVASVKDNEVHLGIAIDAQTASVGAVPSFVAPPEPVTPQEPIEPAHSPPNAPTAGDVREPVAQATFSSPIGTSVGATAPFTPTSPFTSDPRHQAGQHLPAGPTPTWADTNDFGDDEGMFQPTMMRMAGLAAAGLAVAGVVWWRRRRRKSAWERALDLATDYAAQASGYASQASGYASQATDYASQVHPGWWAGLGSAALSLALAYALRPGETSSSDQARAWFDSFKGKTADPGLARLGKRATPWGNGRSGQWDRLMEAASALGASEFFGTLADRLPSADSLPGRGDLPSFGDMPSFSDMPSLDDLLGNTRASRLTTYGLPATGIALAGALIYALTRKAGRPARSTRVADVMTRRPQVIRPDASVAEAASLMRNLDVGAVPICDGSRLVGMLTDRDVAIRVAAEGRDPQVTRVRDVMSPGATWASEDDLVEEAARIMREHQIRRLPIVDERHNLVGIVSLGDLATDVGDDRLSGDTLEKVSRR